MKIEIKLGERGGTVLLDGQDFSQHIQLDDITITPAGPDGGRPVVWLPFGVKALTVSAENAAPKLRVDVNVADGADLLQIGQALQRALDAVKAGRAR